MPNPDIDEYGYYNCIGLLSAVESENLYIINNSDGTVSVYYNENINVNDVLTPIQLSQFCCPILNNDIFSAMTEGQTYEWDMNSTSCRWKTLVDCDNLPPFNVVMNPQGNSGVIFDVDENETCVLNVSFDYLISVSCASLLEIEYSPETQQLLSYQEQLSATTQQLLILSNQPAPSGTFNYTAVNYNIDGGMSAPTGYCITEIGIPVYEALTNAAFQPGESIWDLYMTTGTPPYNQFPNSTETQSLMDQLLLLNNQYNGSLMYECQNYGQLAEETQTWISQLNAYNSTITYLTNQIEYLTTQINNIITGNTCLFAIDALENISLNMSVDIQTPQESVIDSVYSEPFFNIGTDQLYSHLIKAKNSGIYIENYDGINCTSDDCDSLARLIIPELISEGKLINDFIGSTYAENITQLNSYLGTDYFNSNWVHFETTITDQSIISAMTGNNINISISILNGCADFSILVDRIHMNKVCQKKIRNEIIVNKNPGFKLKRTVDNKKSWLSNVTPENRTYDLSMRLTDYYENDNRLVINTKETDLNISIANGIETDVWCYVNDNQCILRQCDFTGYTATTCCCTELSAITGTNITGGTIVLPSGSAYTCSLTVGATGPAGGTIFWVHPTNNCIGLEMTTPGSIGSYEWWVAGAYYLGGTYMEFGYGQGNTSAIIAQLTPPPSQIAAQVCDAYTLGGYSDWYLPSAEEMLLMYTNMTGISGKTYMPNVYWTSTEKDAGHAYYLMNGALYSNEIPPYATWSAPIHKRHAKDVIAIRKINNSPCSTIITTASTISASGIGFSMEEHDCYWIYKYDTNTASTIFNGYWFTSELDGSLGIYNVITQSGGTPSIVDYSNIITKECCQEYDNTLRTLETSTDIGRHLAKVRWNEGCQQCMVVSCTDAHCLDFDDILTSPTTEATTVDSFNDIVTSELINVRCRKITSMYPTLNLLYQRYITSNEYCNNTSSSFNYGSMINFTNLIATHWVDLFEQVIPSTTIWMSNHIYGNTIYDQEKFKYRTGSISICAPNDQLPMPYSVSGDCDVDYYIYDSEAICQQHQQCNDIYYYNGDCGSEFLGTVSITSPEQEDNSGNIILFE